MYRYSLRNCFRLFCQQSELLVMSRVYLSAVSGSHVAVVVGGQLESGEIIHKLIIYSDVPVCRCQPVSRSYNLSVSQSVS